MQKKASSSKASNPTTPVVYVINVESTPPKPISNRSKTKPENGSEAVTVIPIESAITPPSSHSDSMDSVDDVTTSADTTNISEADSNGTLLMLADDEDGARQRQLDDKYGG